ncbi:DNA/RNA polymerase, putative, partial [Rhizoctonia solani AG-3 Rhs1AP]
MQFFAEELRILGHVIDKDGIRMDPDKVTSIENWKTPTNKDLLMSFIGAVGYLAPNCPEIRIPMGVLSKRATHTPWSWGPSDQRAFQETKDIVSKWRAHHRVALDYSTGAHPIYLVTDASYTGASGFVCQGESLENAKVAAFWSGKFKPAQQNYPVHEQELLAVVESLKKFKNLLHGVKFIIKTDHKGLTFLMSQKGASPRQARWFDTLSQFDFEIEYIPGETNKFADALSRIYSNEHRNTKRAESEYVDDSETEDEVPTIKVASGVITDSVETGPETAVVVSEFIDITPPVLRRSTRERKVPERLRQSESRQSAAPKHTETTKSSKRNKKTQEKTQATEAALTEDSTTESAREQPAAEREDPETLDEPSHHVFAKAMVGLNVEEAVKDKYEGDGFFGLISKDPASFPKFEIVDGLMLLNDRERKLLCIPDVMEGERKLRERIIDHAHLSLAHLGHKKTYAYMRDLR